MTRRILPPGPPPAPERPSGRRVIVPVPAEAKQPEPEAEALPPHRGGSRPAKG